MSRITVEDCLDNVGGYFELAHIASKRAVELSRGAPSLLPDTSDRLTAKKEKVAVTALREIAEGLVNKEYFDKDLHNQPDLSLNVADWIKTAQQENELRDQEN